MTNKEPLRPAKSAHLIPEDSRGPSTWIVIAIVAMSLGALLFPFYA